MKVLVVSVLLAVLLYCHGGSITKKQVTKRQHYNIEDELVKLAIHIKSSLFQKKLINATSQFGFLLLGDNSHTYFQNFKLPAELKLLLITKPDQIMNHSLYDNFLASRPFESTNTYKYPKRPRLKDMHSEDILLAELPALVSKYTEKHRHSPDFILLYSYYMPCDVCTDKIINNFGNINRTVSENTSPLWFVAYKLRKSNRAKYINEKNTIINTKKLEDNGIRVLHVNRTKDPTSQ